MIQMCKRDHNVNRKPRLTFKVSRISRKEKPNSPQSMTYVPLQLTILVSHEKKK